MEVGQPIGYFLGLESDGIFQSQAEIDAHPSQSGLGASTSPGDIRYKDQLNVPIYAPNLDYNPADPNSNQFTDDIIGYEADGIIDFNDRVNIGNPQPDFFMGFNISGTYKNWDFNTYLYAELGKDMVRNFERFLPNVNKPSYYLDRWTGAGTSNLVPRLTNDSTNNKLFSDFFVEDASFLRMQNIQIGYNFPQDVLEKVGLSKVRLYTSINNLFTLTKYTGFDPTVNEGAIGAGIDGGTYPSARQFLLGLNVTF